MNIHKTFENLTLNGISEKRNDEYFITGTLEGDVEVECVKCLTTFKKQIKEDIKFRIVKPPFNGFDENYDIIEQKKLNIEEILQSEVESVKNSFDNICDKCKKEEFNKEF